MVGLHVDAALNFVQTRHDQGSECLTHLRFRDGAVCTTTRRARLRRPASARTPARCASRSPRCAVDALPARQRRGAFARAQDDLRLRIPAPPVPAPVPGADLSRCRVIHNFVEYADCWRSERRTAQASTPARCCWPAASMPARASANSSPRRRRACRRRARRRSPATAPSAPHWNARYGGAQVRFLGWQAYRGRDPRWRPAATCAWCRRCARKPAAPPCSKRWRWASSASRWRAAARPNWPAYQLYDGQLQLADTMAAAGRHARWRWRRAAPCPPRAAGLRRRRRAGLAQAAGILCRISLRFSIVTCTWNSAATLADTLASVRAPDLPGPRAHLRRRRLDRRHARHARRLRRATSGCCAMSAAASAAR